MSLLLLYFLPFALSCSVGLICSHTHLGVCLCVYLQEEIDGTPEADYMCGSITSAEMARDSNSRRLVLVHQIHTLDEKSKQEKALSDITSIFKGDVVWGEELMDLDLL